MIKLRILALSRCSASRTTEWIENVYAGKVLLVVCDNNALVRFDDCGHDISKALLGRPAAVPSDMRRAQTSAAFSSKANTRPRNSA
jgi:hypothetical protein